MRYAAITLIASLLCWGVLGAPALAYRCTGGVGYDRVFKAQRAHHRAQDFRALKRERRAARRRARYVRQRIYEFALREVGVHEWGSNRGPRVDDYGRVTHAVGAAWCASFVSSAVRYAGGSFASASVSAWAAAIRKGT